jgi:hypothetical protein
MVWEADHELCSIIMNAVIHTEGRRLYQGMVWEADHELCSIIMNAVIHTEGRRLYQLAHTSEAIDPH